MLTLLRRGYDPVFIPRLSFSGGTFLFGQFQSFLLDDSFWNIAYAILEFCHDVAVKVQHPRRGFGTVSNMQLGIPPRTRCATCSAWCAYLLLAGADWFAVLAIRLYAQFTGSQVPVTFRASGIVLLFMFGRMTSTSF